MCLQLAKGKEVLNGHGREDLALLHVASYLPAATSGLLPLVEAVKELGALDRVKRARKTTQDYCNRDQDYCNRGLRLNSTLNTTESWGRIDNGQGEGVSGWKNTKRNLVG